MTPDDTEFVSEQAALIYANHLNYIASITNPSSIRYMYVVFGVRIQSYYHKKNWDRWEFCGFAPAPETHNGRPMRK